MNLEQIIEELREKLHKRILDKGYDQNEVMVKFSIDEDGSLSYVKDKEVFVKDGKTDDSGFGTHLDFKPFFNLFESDKPKYLYIKGNKESVHLYSDVSAPGLETVPGFEDLELFIFNRMNPFLEEGVEYINQFGISPALGAGMSLFYAYKDGVKSDEIIPSIYLFDKAEFVFALALESLIGTLEKGKMIKLIARKDQPLEIRYCDGNELIAGIKPFYHFLENCEEISFDVLVSEDLDWYGLQDLEFSGYYVQNGKQLELKNCPYDLFQFLLLMLEPMPKRFEVKITPEDFRIFADKPYPEYGIEAKEEDLFVADNDLEGICRFIESGRENKLRAAIEAIEKNSETKKRLEKRYLNYVRASSENLKATLADMTAEMFSDETKNIFMGHRPDIKNDYISFGYHNEDKSKRLIDFIGAMTKNYVDIDNFMREINKSFQKEEHEYDRIAVHERYRNKFENGIRAEIKLNPDGWYSSSYRQLLDMSVTKIFLDKSEFHEASRMPFLKEYMLWLNLSAASWPIHIDVFNSYRLHDLTEVYWMFNTIPQITWFQSTPAYPPYPYKQKRSALIRIDNGEWEELKID